MKDTCIYLISKSLKQLLISKINSATIVYHHNPHLTRIKQRRAAQNCCSRFLMLPLAKLPLLSVLQSSNDSPNRSNNFIPHDHGLLSCHRPPNGDLIAPLLSYSVLIFCGLLITQENLPQIQAFFSYPGRRRSFNI